MDASKSLAERMRAWIEAESEGNHPALLPLEKIATEVEALGAAYRLSRGLNASLSQERDAARGALAEAMKQHSHYVDGVCDVCRQP